MGLHDGHRERLRKNYLETGLRGKSEHQILEILLTYAIPRIDVNPVAHELMDNFGSIAAVLDADINELTKFKGISENGAVLLKLIPDLFPVYFESKNKEKVNFPSIGDVKKYMVSKYAGEKNEVFYVLCFDTHMNLIRAIRHVEGTPDKANLDIKKLVLDVINSGASQIVIAHNHLSGNVEFSPKDVEATYILKDTFLSIGIKLREHRLISGGKVAMFSDYNDYLSK